jgi:hypothetical protein
MRKHVFNTAKLGFKSKVTLADVFDDGKLFASGVETFTLEQPPHSVRMIEIKE